MATAARSQRLDIRRAQLLDVLADHVLEHGLSTASLRPLAKAAGTSDRMLLYYFEDKAELVAAILGVIAGRLAAELAQSVVDERLPLPTLRARLASVLLGEAVWPFMAVWLELASLSARDPVYRRVAEDISRGFLAWAEAQLDSADDVTRARDAALLLVMIEGMTVLKSVGLGDIAQQAFSEPGEDRARSSA